MPKPSPSAFFIATAGLFSISLLIPAQIGDAGVPAPFFPTEISVQQANPSSAYDLLTFTDDPTITHAIKGNFWVTDGGTEDDPTNSRPEIEACTSAHQGTQLTYHVQTYIGTQFQTGVEVSYQYINRNETQTGVVQTITTNTLERIAP